MCRHIWFRSYQEMQLINEIHNSTNSVMILAKDGNKIVGMVSLSGESKARIKHRSNLGISVLKEYWHQFALVDSDILHYIILFILSFAVTFLD